MAYTCPLCKEEREGDEYCVEATSMQGTFCVLHSVLSAKLVWRLQRDDGWTIDLTEELSKDEVVE